MYIFRTRNPKHNNLPLFCMIAKDNIFRKLRQFQMKTYYSVEMWSRILERMLCQGTWADANNDSSCGKLSSFIYSYCWIKSSVEPVNVTNALNHTNATLQPQENKYDVISIYDKFVTLFCFTYSSTMIRGSVQITTTG